MATKKKLPHPNAITPAAADAFQMLIHKWQQKLNLMDWRIERSPTPARSALAEVKSMSLKDRLAVYKLGADFGDTKPITDQSLEEIACHETIHIFLCELIEVAKDPASSQESLEAAEHRCVNVLVGLLVPGN